MYIESAALVVLLGHLGYRIFRVMTIEWSFVRQHWNLVGRLATGAASLFLLMQLWSSLLFLHNCGELTSLSNQVEVLLLALVAIAAAPPLLFEAFVFTRCAAQRTATIRSTPVSAVGNIIVAGAYLITTFRTILFTEEIFLRLGDWSVLIVSVAIITAFVAVKKARFFLTPKSCKTGKWLEAITGAKHGSS